MTTWPSWLPLRANLRELSPYGAPQVPATAIMNTNENPYSPSLQLAQAISDRIKEVSLTLNRYPDRDAITLRNKLADFINGLSCTNFSSENVWAANGSNEIIQSLFLAFGSGKALGFTPSYSMHPLIAKVTQVQWIAGTRALDFSLDVDSAIAQIEDSQPVLTFITTPNNPTGTSISLSELERIAQNCPGLLVIDEAYAEFSDEKSAVTLIEKYPHIVVIRTMSKAFAFAGARLGYLVAHPSVIESMFLVRLPYHLSALTQAAAEVAIDFSDELLATVSQLRKARELMKVNLEQLGLRVVPSSSNFLLFTGFKQPSAQLWQALLDRGVLIRDVGLLGYLRVTIGNEAENKNFIESLSSCLGEK
ncbi:MAG: histidinol-phosphate transaminase [Actinobacteria bacterium]|nr:histidinol-phosphate transaminase [Actinomycetota bacterium]